ncbi:MAG: signal peptidase II [Elusimicrobiota bacterium]|nr:signal peptidase II [Elusimicrobiota bacterium]
MKLSKPIILAIAIFVLDQITKFLVVKFIGFGKVIAIIKPFYFFNLVNLHNTGIAFSAFTGGNLFFLIFVSIFLIALFIWLLKNYDKLSKLQRYAFCMIFAGGAGNLVDRIFRGWVVDFLDFGFYGLRWPAFNIADSAVCIAAALIFISLIKIKKS